jgi:hypothetical protein
MPEESVADALLAAAKRDQQAFRSLVTMLRLGLLGLCAFERLP